MKENKKEYIGQLLTTLRLLEEKVHSAEESETLSFSFFNESFDRMQQISRLLHQLQSVQIEEMKRQMEQLVLFLSEKMEEESISVTPGEPEVNESSPTEIIEEENQPERVSLPGYKNPRLSEPLPVEQPVPANDAAYRDEQRGIPSLNDVIQAPPSLLDLKRGISLNDRFLFQRELFHNDREEMNSMMIRLNAFESFEKVEEYLKSQMNWNFDDSVVKDFLRVIKKGFA